MQDAPKSEKRKDSRGRVLRTGESQRPDGSYQFRWSEAGQRRTRYAPTLEDLRQKEDEIARQRLLGRLSTGGTATVGQLVERHMLLRPNLRERTRRSYRNTIAHLQQDRLERVMALHPIIHCNAKEAEILLKRIQLPISNITKNARMLSADTENLVVITDGDRGCVACNDGEILSIPSFPVRAIDGTGAGDGHIGTILSCLYKGYSLKRALSIASAVSAAIVQVEGPVLSRQQYEKLLPSFAKEEDF